MLHHCVLNALDKSVGANESEKKMQMEKWILFPVEFACIIVAADIEGR